MNMPQIFKIKCIANFGKYRNRKKSRSGGVKMAKSNKIGKTEELIAGYQEAEYVSRMSCLHCAKMETFHCSFFTFNIFCESSNYDSSKSTFLVRIHL